MLESAADSKAQNGILILKRKELTTVYVDKFLCDILRK